MRSGAASDETILDELRALAERGDNDLLQFRSLPGARQYLRLYRLFRRHVRPDSAVLDWGAGNGHFSYFLWRAGYRPTAFTLDRAGPTPWLDEATVRWVAGDPAEPVRLPFASASFDAVTSVGVLEHVRETGGSERASLGEIVRCLRPNGLFVAYHVPNRTSAVEFFARRIPGQHRHAFRFTRNDIEVLVRGVGLELVEWRRYGVLPRNSCNALPESLRGARALAGSWDRCDQALERLLAPLCQNHLFVARKWTAC